MLHKKFVIKITAWKVSKYGVISGPCIQTEYRKLRTRINSLFGQFSRSEFQDVWLSHYGYLKVASYLFLVG